MTPIAPAALQKVVSHAGRYGFELSVGDDTIRLEHASRRIESRYLAIILDLEDVEYCPRAIVDPHGEAIGERRVREAADDGTPVAVGVNGDDVSDRAAAAGKLEVA